MEGILEIEVLERDIDKIIPYERNPRKNDEAVDKVALSLEEFGWQQPIVVDADGVIVVGHTRWKAAKKLKYKTCPVIVASTLSPEQIKAYRIADNKSGEIATWDMDLLKMEVDDLIKADFDIELTGFDLEELELNDDGSDKGLQGGFDNGNDLKNIGLSGKFGLPPFSVLNAREGWWQDRKRQWISLGIKSELGRGGHSIDASGTDNNGELELLQKQKKGYAVIGGSKLPLDRKHNASPGGSPRPSCSYSKDKARGDGTGKAMNGGTLGAIAPNQKDILNRNGKYKR